MPSRSLEVDSMDDTDAPQGGEEHAPIADMGGLSTLSAAASERILEDGDPDLFGSGEFTPPAKSQKNTTSNRNKLSGTVPLKQFSLKIKVLNFGMRLPI